jgi:putative insertion element HTH domain-containing protein
MIDNNAKKKLMKELQKSGNVYLSCLKVNIDRSTHYRWREKNKKYREESNRLISIGRENNCDIAEHSLMRNVTSGKIESIKYYLAHNSERYKSKKSSIIFHKSISKIPHTKNKTLEELIDEDEEKLNDHD